MLVSLLWLSIVVISANVFLFLNKKNLITYFIGIFTVWPFLFILSSYFFNEASIVIVFYILSFFSGLVVIIKKKLWVFIIIVLAIFFSLNFLFSNLFKNPKGDSDSINYAYSAARLNYNQWGKVCDDKVNGSAPSTNQSKYAGIINQAKYTRLPMLGFIWTNNIFQLPIKNSQIYSLSLIFSTFCILFLVLILELKLYIKNNHKILKYVFFALISSGVYGGYSLLSSLMGQINQSYALLLSIITIYLSLTKSFNLLFKMIFPIIVFFAYPEFLPVYALYLSIPLLLESKSLKGLPSKILLYSMAFLPLVLMIIPNYQYYMFYYRNQFEAIPGWFPILSYDKNSWITYFLIENPVIDYVILTSSIIIAFIIISMKKKSSQLNETIPNFMYYLFILLIILTAYILITIAPNQNYASFKTTGWIFPLLALYIVLITNKSKSGYYQKSSEFVLFSPANHLNAYYNNISKLSSYLFYLLIIICIFRLANFYQTYMTVAANTSFMPVKYLPLDKTESPNKIIINDSFTPIDRALSVAHYNCPARGCICLR